MRDNPGRGLDPAEDVRRCCKNSPSILSYIDKKTSQSCDRGSEVAQFTADETGNGQFLRGNGRYLAEEGVVRKISSPKRSGWA